MAETKTAAEITDKLEAVQRLFNTIHETVVLCREELSRATHITFGGDADPAQAEREIYRNNGLYATAKQVDELLLDLLRFEQMRF